MNFVVSPTSTTLATVSRSSLITLWDISSGTLMYSFKGPRGVVNSMAFDPTGHFLATAAADRSVMVRCPSLCCMINIIADVLFCPWLGSPSASCLYCFR